MGFLKILKVWKKKRNVSSGKSDTCAVATQASDTCDATTQVMCTEDLKTFEGIQVENKLMCDVSTDVSPSDLKQTSHVYVQMGSWWDGDLIWQLHECRDTIAAYEHLLRKKRRQKEKLREELKMHKSREKEVAVKMPSQIGYVSPQMSATSSAKEQKKTEVSSIWQPPMCDDDEEEERRTAIVLAKMKEICQRYQT